MAGGQGLAGQGQHYESYVPPVVSAHEQSSVAEKVTHYESIAEQSQKNTRSATGSASGSRAGSNVNSASKRDSREQNGNGKLGGSYAGSGGKASSSTSLQHSNSEKNNSMLNMSEIAHDPEAQATTTNLNNDLILMNYASAQKALQQQHISPSPVDLHFSAGKSNDKNLRSADI